MKIDQIVKDDPAVVRPRPPHLLLASAVASVSPARGRTGAPAGPALYPRRPMTVTGLIDSHCHIDGEKFDGDREAVLERARAAGIVASIVVGGTSRTIEDLDRPVRICGDTPDLHPTVGVHPHDAEVLRG